MSLVDTTEVQCLEVIATATALPNVLTIPLLRAIAAQVRDGETNITVR